MKDPDDIQLKKELDDISRRIADILKKVETLDPARQDNAEKQMD